MNIFDIGSGVIVMLISSVVNLFISFCFQITFSGNLTILPCVARACKILCLIHQTAYEINLNPLVSSNLSAALISPRFPSLMRSCRGNHWFWYCFATVTTNLKLAFMSFSRAFWSPCLILCANSISSKTSKTSSLTTSWKYLLSDSDSRLVIFCVILSCLIENIYISKVDNQIIYLHINVNRI